MCAEYGIGWDAHAYYVAWSGGLYEELPGSVDAYNYSPLFAQVIWPLTLLPWPVFCARARRGRGRRGRLARASAARSCWPSAVWLACLPEILSGNVFWLLAVMAVVGFSHASAVVRGRVHQGPALPGPGVVPGAGRVARGSPASSRPRSRCSRSRSLISPGEWLDWIDFLRTSAGDSSGLGLPDPLGHHLPPGGPLPAGPRGGRRGRADRPAVAAAGRDGAREPGRRAGAPSPCSPPSPGSGGCGRLVRHDGAPELDAGSAVV